jgi:WD40 repeat protein
VSPKKRNGPVGETTLAYIKQQPRYEDLKPGTPLDGCTDRRCPMLLLKNTKVTLNCLAFSPDGKLLAAGGYKGEVQLWDAASGKLMARLPGRHHAINGVFFVIRGTRLLGFDDTVVTWDPQAPEAEAEEWDETRERTQAVAVAADGGCLCHAQDQGYSEGHDLVCQALPSREVLWKHRLKARPSPLLFSPDGRLLLHRDARRPDDGDRQHFVILRDAATGAVHQELPWNGSLLDDVALSPDGRTLAWPNGRNLYLWQLDPPRELARQISPGRTEFHSVAFHPSGRFFATANGDGKVDFWDAATGAHQKAFDWKIGKLHDVVFDATGDRAACCSKMGQIVVWDIDE